jgi:hypothetical protein
MFTYQGTEARLIIKLRKLHNSGTDSHSSVEKLLLPHLFYEVPTNELLKTIISPKFGGRTCYGCLKNNCYVKYGPRRDAVNN